jgi:hypothetical protein
VYAVVKSSFVVGIYTFCNRKAIRIIVVVRKS